MTTTGILVCMLFFGLEQKIFSQSKQETRILFLLDASGSMKEKWGKEKKFSTAKKIINQMLDSLSKERNIQVAIRVFGHQSPKAMNDCQDTKLEVPFSPQSFKGIKSRLEGISPQGYTPIALSLKNAIGDFPTGSFKNMIILITDGVENCEGDPCEASADLQKAGIFLKPYIVGLGLSEDQKKIFDCVGEIYDITEEKKAGAITNVIISTVLNPTTLQVNLLDQYGKATETNVNMTFFESPRNISRYNIYHTMTATGNPDTLYIDPATAYSIKVHTLPSVLKKDIRLVRGKHTIAGIDASQGALKINMPGSNKYKNIQIRVSEKDKKQTLYYQNLNTSQNYLTGVYEAEIMSIPRIKIDSVRINQSKVTVYNIAGPGTLNISALNAGFISIFSIAEKGNMELVYTLSPLQQKEMIAMQPGNYTAVYRAKSSTNTASTKEYKFNITSGAATTIRF